MDDMASVFDAMALKERLKRLKKEELWMHLEAGSSLEKYPAKQHARRVRDRLDIPEGLIYLPGAPSRNNEDSDMPAPFRQRRYFYYLSGVNEPNCHVTYDLKQDILTLFIPRINPDRAFWNGCGSTPAEAMDKYDVDEVFYVDELESWVQDWFLKHRCEERLYVLREEWMPSARFPWPVDAVSLQPAMDACRKVKDEHEVALIRKANDITSEAHKQVLANITKFKNEAQVEGLFLDVCVSKKAKQQAYDPIAASGPNAGTLHYDANNEDFGDRQLMCLDAGCEFDLYASDITRTFPLSGSWPSKEAENIYKLVERMQESCIQKLAPGVRYLDLHILAHQIAIDGLLRLGILHNGTREEIYKAGTSRAFFPHGLGHHVGLEVHDVGQRELMSFYEHSLHEKVPSLYPEDFHVPVYDEKLCMAPTYPQSPHLEEGNVVTVEPGIYFSSYVLSYFYLPSPIHSKYINTEALSRYLPVGGVRIEDDILITHKGYENLTTAPKGDAMLEIIRTQGRSFVPKLKERKVMTEPLRRAPGIPKFMADPIFKPISRAATEPVKTASKASLREENLGNHRLFLERSSVTAGDTAKKTEVSRGTTSPLPQSWETQPSALPLCGILLKGIEHMYMNWEHDHRVSSMGLVGGSPKCQQCVVLSETVDRLRETLSRSTQVSPKLETGKFSQCDISRPTTDNRPSKEIQGAFVPPSHPEAPEMRQITPLPPRLFEDRTRPLASRTSVPSPAHRTPPQLASHVPTSSSFPLHIQYSESRSRTQEYTPSIPQQPKQRRSVTFDAYSTSHSEPHLSASLVPAAVSGSNMRYPTQTAYPANHVSNTREHRHIHAPQRASTLQGDRTTQPSEETTWVDVQRLCSSIDERDIPRTANPQSMGRAQRDINIQVRPSIPALQQSGSSRQESTARDRMSEFIPIATETREQDLRRIRSLGPTLPSLNPSTLHTRPHPEPTVHNITDPILPSEHPSFATQHQVSAKLGHELDLRAFQAWVREERRRLGQAGWER